MHREKIDMPRYLRNLIIGLIVIGLLLGLDFVFQAGLINPYYTRILMLCGISITLAVSLNLINGFTGQFSIGHAGFMAVGAYSAAYFSVTYGANLANSLGGGKLGWVVALTLTTLVGAAVAGVAGLAVGIPSLRLRGDYLAIVTLGFGQIIVVFLNNIEAVGGARGYSGIPIVKSFFWIFLIAVLTIVDRLQHRELSFRTRAHLDSRRRACRGSDGRQYHALQSNGVCDLVGDGGRWRCVAGPLRWLSQSEVV